VFPADDILQRMSTVPDAPPGFSLLGTLESGGLRVGRIDWSPGGRMLAGALQKGTIAL